MEPKTRFRDGLIMGVFILFGCGLGFLAGNSFVGEYNPPWTHYQLKHSPKGLVEIAYVEINSYLLDPTGDVVYIEDNTGKIYSNTVFQDTWSVVDRDPNWNSSYLSKCATEWLGEPIVSHLGDYPPTEKKVIDSAGVRFERPISIIVRCYLLLEDGSIEVWVHSGDAYGAMGHDLLKVIYTVSGFMIGIIISAIFIRFRKKLVTPQI